jgi:hypothetical protein
VGKSRRWIGGALIGLAIGACGTISELDEYSQGSQVVDALAPANDAQSRETGATGVDSTMGLDVWENEGGADGGAGAPDTETEEGAADAAQVDAEMGAPDASQMDVDAPESEVEAAVDATEAGAGCLPGHANCNGGTSCECATPACCTGACQTSHANGLGQSFYDCASQGTHNQTQAQEACASLIGDGGVCSQTSTCCGLCFGGGNQIQAVCGSASGQCYCWSYSGQGSGTVQTGNGSGCKAACPGRNDPSWN